MKTSEHVRQIAAELSAVIDKNDRPIPNQSALSTLEQIRASARPVWAKSLIARLLVKARQFYRVSSDDNVMAHSLLVDMHSYIAGLREGASAAEQRGD